MGNLTNNRGGIVNLSPVAADSVDATEFNELPRLRLPEHVRSPATPVQLRSHQVDSTLQRADRPAVIETLTLR